MVDRRVTATKKDGKRTILALCNPGEPWSPRWKEDAIKDIDDTHEHRYYVEEGGLPRVFVKVIKLAGVRHLATYTDSRSPNNLDELPNG